MPDLDDIQIDDADLNDVDLDDDMDLESFGDIDESIDVPHIKVRKSALKRFLKVANQVANTSGRDVDTKSVSLQVEGDCLVCRASDRYVYLEEELELENMQDVLHDHIVVLLEEFHKLLKAAPANIIISKDENDEYQLRLIGGEVSLETYNRSVEKYKYDANLEHKGDYDSIDLHSITKSLGQMAKAAVSNNERKITFNANGAFVKYMWAIARAEGDFPDIDMEVKDIFVVKSLLRDIDQTVSIYRTSDDEEVDRVVIKGETFAYAFLQHEGQDISKTLKNNMSQALDRDSIHVDFEQLYKMVNLSAELSYSTGKIDLDYYEDCLRVIFNTKKKSDSVFDITGSLNGDPQPLSEPVSVQSSLFKQILKCFSNFSSVQVMISDKGVGVESDDYSAVVYTEN